MILTGKAKEEITKTNLEWLEDLNKVKENTIPFYWFIVDYYGADQSTGRPRIKGEVLNTSYDNLDWSKIDDYSNYIKKE